MTSLETLHRAHRGDQNGYMVHQNQSLDGNVMVSEWRELSREQGG
jgi:hypothetical protein